MRILAGKLKELYRKSERHWLTLVRNVVQLRPAGTQRLFESTTRSKKRANCGWPSRYTQELVNSGTESVGECLLNQHRCVAFRDMSRISRQNRDLDETGFSYLRSDRTFSVFGTGWSG